MSKYIIGIEYVSFEELIIESKTPGDALKKARKIAAENSLYEYDGFNILDVEEMDENADDF